MAQFYTIYGMNDQSATIINLDSSEILHVAIVPAGKNKTGRYIVFSSSIGKYAQFMVDIDSEITSIYVKVNVIGDPIVIQFFCTTRSNINHALTINDEYVVDNINGAYKYKDFIHDFCHDGRVRNEGELILDITKFPKK